MADRFDKLKKVPDEPAARLLASANAKLKTKTDAPASASVSIVLSELEQKEAWVDMIRLLSVSLPARECVWWACLAGRQLTGEEPKSACVAAAEAWVFEPTEENRIRVQQVMESASSGDRTTPVATAALYAPGTLGPGEMNEIEAPPGIVSACAFGVNLHTLKVVDDPNEQFQVIIDRALDIARGGNGRSPNQTPKEAADEGAS